MPFACDWKVSYGAVPDDEHDQELPVIDEKAFAAVAGRIASTPQSKPAVMKPVFFFILSPFT